MAIIDEHKIIELYVENKIPMYKIAKKLGLDPRKISKILDKKDIKKRGNGGMKFSDEHKRKIGIASKRNWNCNDSIYNSDSYKEKRKDIIFGGKYWKGKKHSIKTIRKMKDSQTAEKNIKWSGGVINEYNGYICATVKNHPFMFNVSGYLIKYGYIKQHRLVMENWLKKNNPNSNFLIEINGIKYLKCEIIVHHINGIKDDNRIENLKCMTNGEHTTHHNKIRWNKEVKKNVRN